MSRHLLTKPLEDNLTDLLSKVKLLDETKITQAIIESTTFLMIELSRLDSEVLYDN